ncbi:MFS transporter [Alkalihalobacillus sp. MEB130]|uniref:MFS transporter n=1 Tax=Alkalihalobacillus sp. MEB130 TaxID=2976704 RepID=UPI0028DFD47C|nr:MFS transporter [Alkalihalobacillus sp. MEB130]MDT8861320.1 MFS transporter [Alkalihalobacillus sp. MEB130]
MKNKWIVLFVSLAAFFGPFTQTIYVPLIPEVQQHFGSSELVVNITISIFTLVLAFMQIVYGPLVDRYGRKKVLLPAIFIYIVGSIGAALSPTIWVLIFFRVVQAAGIAAGSVVATTVIGDLFQGKMLGRSMGTFQMCVSLGPVLGPLAGGLIGGYTTFNGVFWFLTIMGIILFLSNFYLLPETRRPNATSKRFRFGDFGLIFMSHTGSVVLLYGFIQYYTYYNFIVFLPHLLQQNYVLSTSQVGWLFIPLTLTVVLGNILGGRIQEWISQRKLLLISSICNIFSILLYVLLAPLSLPFVMLTTALFGLCMGVSSPIQTTILVQTFSQIRGTAIGAYNFSRYLGMAAGPMIGTILYSWRPFTEFYFSAFLFVCILILVVQRLKRPVRPQDHESSRVNG